ncbi:flagellar motor stator protein MotA [Magnetospirillum sp. ME-1]|uniref:flagellar motor stator protein MotA n=1 Tax=Magnetospirillum sp. ME-1 TaxID=1639348 RepID=UPI000A17F59F|nr:flagellar motor stator protein MotA [Magnetospirillum sp. ME-1]ARJ65300.1 flagellar motor stator protein MotA [Magnetospirillum sp. ME-1]
MFAIIGIVVTFVSVIGGYAAPGGHLSVLFQPFEWLIIIGAAVGSLLLGNPKSTIIGIGKNIGLVFKGAHHGKDDYIELLSVLYAVFKLAKTKGDLALESHVEKPDESPLFGKFPKFSSDHHTRTFFCDYLRLLTLGTSNAHELESIIDGELEAHHKHYHEIAHAVNLMGDAMPALGIVAAVLGVIHTMGSITEPPEVLGHLIGAALVGTFSGVLISYAFIAPIARNMQMCFDSDHYYFMAIKAGLLGHMQGYAPQVSIEFARKILPDELRPTFQELEETVTNLPPD